MNKAFGQAKKNCIILHSTISKHYNFYYWFSSVGFRKCMMSFWLIYGSLLIDFFMLSSLRAFLIFLNIYHKYAIGFKCGNELGHFKVSMSFCLRAASFLTFLFTVDYNINVLCKIIFFLLSVADFKTEIFVCLVVFIIPSAI